jgi:hypothetical protein
MPRPSSARVHAAVPTAQEWSSALQAALQAHFAEPGLRVRGCSAHDCGSEHSLLGELASWRSGSGLALHARTVEVIRAGGRASTLELILKPKPGAERLRALTAEVAARCNPELGAAFVAHGAASEFAGAAERELALYAGASGPLRSHMPIYFGAFEMRGVPVLLLERVRDAALIDSVDTTAQWSAACVQAALDGAARMHAQWLGREQELAGLHVRPNGAEADSAATGGWLAALAAHAAPWLRHWLGEEAARAHGRLAADWRLRMQPARMLPRTLVHHDFNPRNIALRSTPLGLRLCAFDWELAAYDLPQRDLVELLSFVLTPETTAQAPGYLEHARLALERASRRAFETTAWHSGVRIALADFGARRLPMYFIAHRFRPQRFLERVARTWWQLANALGTAP